MNRNLYLQFTAVSHMLYESFISNFVSKSNNYQSTKQPVLNATIHLYSMPNCRSDHNGHLTVD